MHALNDCTITYTLFYICLLKLFVFANSFYVMLCYEQAFHLSPTLQLFFFIQFNVFLPLSLIRLLYHFVDHCTNKIFIYSRCIRWRRCHHHHRRHRHRLNLCSQWNLHFIFNISQQSTNGYIRAAWLLLVQSSHLFIFHLYGSSLSLSLSFVLSLVIKYSYDSTNTKALLLWYKHIDYSLLHMYELFTFPFFQILVSFVCSLFFCCRWFCHQTLLSVFYICFSSARSFFEIARFLRSIASHLIQLNSFSIVFTIMCAIHSFSMFRFTVALLLFAYIITPKRRFFPIAIRYL